MGTRIAFDANTAVGQLVAEAIDQIIEGRDKLFRVVAILDAAGWDGAAVTQWSNIEAEATVAPGSGDDFYNCLVAAKVALDVIGIESLRNLDQG